MATLFAFALVGCGKPVPNAARYEARITALESNVTELYQRNANRKADITNINEMVQMIVDGSTNQLAFDAKMMSQDSNQQVQLELQLLMIQDLQARLTNRTQSTYRQPTVYRAPQNSGPTVMPANVAATIRAEAERRYPTDYDMQNFVIKQQTEAWHKLNP